MPSMIDKAEIERALLTVRDQSTFINNLLVDTLHWPIEGNVANVEEITYNWSAAELRTLDLEKRLVDGEVRQIANLDPKQPWGIFILEFKNPDAFIAERGMTGTLRKVLRGLRCWHNGGRDRAKNIRYALESLEEKVRAEQEHGPLS